MASVRLQDYGGFQDKQNYVCLVARVALEKYASGPEISNQQSCKQSLATTQSWIAFGTLLVFCYNFSVSCLCATHSKQSRTSWNNDILLLFQTCHCRIAGQEEQFWELVTTTWPVASLPLARLPVLPRQAKQLHGGWNWTWEKSHCTWNVKSGQHNMTQSWRFFERQVATYNFAASLF